MAVRASGLADCHSTRQQIKLLNEMFCVQLVYTVQSSQCYIRDTQISIGTIWTECEMWIESRWNHQMENREHSQSERGRDRYVNVNAECRIWNVSQNLQIINSASARSPNASDIHIYCDCKRERERGFKLRLYSTQTYICNCMLAWVEREKAVTNWLCFFHILHAYRDQWYIEKSVQQ